MTNETSEAVATWLSVAAELLVAWVIYYELEGGQVNQFLEDAEKLSDERRKIYLAFCGLSRSPSKSQRQMFKEHLESAGDEDLLKACHSNIRLFSRVGSRLPAVWWLRRTPVDWHVPAIAWMILGPYVEERRSEAGPSYAKTFLTYALASTKRLLEQKRNVWILRDPNRARKQDARFTREEFVAMKKELEQSIKRRN